MTADSDFEIAADTSSAGASSMHATRATCAVARRPAVPPSAPTGGFATAATNGDRIRCSFPVTVSSLPSGHSTTKARRSRSSRCRNRRTAMRRPAAPAGARFAWDAPTVTRDVRRVDRRVAMVPLVDESKPLVATRTIQLGARMTFHGHDWLVNGETHHHDAPIKAGELQIWNVVNDTGMDHPFHLHGFFFQVVAIDGVRVTPHAWRHRQRRRQGSVTARVCSRRPTRPVDVSLHILEHHAAGNDGALRSRVVTGFRSWTRNEGRRSFNGRLAL